MRRCAHTALFTKMVASTTEMSTSQKMTTIIRQSFSSFGGKLVEEEQSSSLPDFRDGKTRSWSAASNNSSSSRRRYHHQSQRCYSGRGGVLLNDTHDVSRGREGGDYERVLSKLTHDTLVVGILSDVLYPFALQRELADCMPNAQLYTIDSPHGHDSFLIEIKSLNDVIRRWRSGENVEVRDPCEQEDFDIRTDTTSDAETLKRTIRALREELARVHGNLRRARTRADIYLQKLQSSH